MLFFVHIRWLVGWLVRFCLFLDQWLGWWVSWSVVSWPVGHSIQIVTINFNIKIVQELKLYTDIVFEP